MAATIVNTTSQNPQPLRYRVLSGLRATINAFVSIRMQSPKTSCITVAARTSSLHSATFIIICVQKSQFSLSRPAKCLEKRMAP